MKIKNHIFFCCLSFAILVQAQQTDEQKYALTTSVTTYGLSVISILDPYLSPLNYSGNLSTLNIIDKAFHYTNLNRHFLSPNNQNVSTQSCYNYLFGATFNPTYSAMILYYGQNMGRGFHYHLRPQKGMHLLVGGVMDLDFGMKLNSRNINNPVNVDLSTNLNLSAVLMYDFVLLKRPMQLQFKLENPLLGCMFVPLQGASYYEIFQLGDMSNAFHFSSLHNKQGVDETISLDVPFSRSIWRFGLNFHNLKYTANDMVFRRSEFSLMVGTTFDYVTFTGLKNKAPKNFVSTK